MAVQHTLYLYFAWIGAPADVGVAVLWTTIPLPDSWMDTHRHWELGHATSAVLDLIGFGALIASVLFDRTTERANG